MFEELYIITLTDLVLKRKDFSTETVQMVFYRFLLLLARSSKYFQFAVLIIRCCPVIFSGVRTYIKQPLSGWIKPFRPFSSVVRMRIYK